MHSNASGRADRPRGRDDSIRRTAGRQIPDWWPDGHTVLGVWAHPDDEAYLSAGLMLRAVGAGGRVVCRHATRGEHGTIDPSTWPPARLAARRAAELASSLRVLGVREHGFLGYEDGACHRVAPDDVVPALAERPTGTGTRWKPSARPRRANSPSTR